MYECSSTYWVAACSGYSVELWYVLQWYAVYISVYHCISCFGHAMLRCVIVSPIFTSLSTVCICLHFLKAGHSYSSLCMLYAYSISAISALIRSHLYASLDSQSLFPDRFEYISGPSADTVKAFGEERQGYDSSPQRHTLCLTWWFVCQARCEMWCD